MKSEIPVSSVKEVKQFYKPTLKPWLGYNKPTIRSEFSPPRKTNIVSGQPKSRITKNKNHHKNYSMNWKNDFIPVGILLTISTS